MILLTLYLLACFGLPSIKKYIDNIYIYEYQKLSYYLYDYFDGYYLSFTSNNSFIGLPSNPQFAHVKTLPYNSTNANQSNNYYSYVTWSDDTCNYLLDFMDSTIYLYSIIFADNTVQLISSYPINATINQVTLWEYSQETYIIIQATSEKNFIFISNFTSFNCSDIDFPIPNKLIMWDLYYAETVSTCQVSGTYLIPFVATFTDFSNNSVLLVYNFSNPLSPNMIYSLDNNYFIDSDFQFYPVQIATLADSTENVTITVLSLNYGILYFQFINGMFQEQWPRVLIEQFNLTYSMILVSNYFFNSTIGAPLVIVIGSINGLVVVDFYGHSVMLSLQGVSSFGSILSVLNAIFIENIYFVYIENNEIMVIFDRETIKDYAYIVRLEENVVKNCSNIKWTVIYYQGSFMIILSDIDGIKTFNLTFEYPILTFKQSIPSDTYYIEAMNSTNNFLDTQEFSYESCVNNATITNLDDLYELQLCTDNRCFAENFAVPQVIFQGLNKTVQFNLYEHISGWNMSFNAQYEEKSDNYSLNFYNYEKFSPGTVTLLKKNYTQVILTGGYVIMQFNEGIDFYKADFTTLIRSLQIKDIISVEFYFSLVYVIYEDLNRYISVNTPYETNYFTVDNQCSMITFCGEYLICGGGNTISVYFCSNNNCTIVSIFSSYKDFQLKITSLTSVNYSAEDNCYLYILNEYTNLYILSLTNIFKNSYYVYDTSYIVLNQTSKIYATSLRFYTFYKTTMTIYSPTMTNETQIDLNNDIAKIFFIDNFVYISTSDNELMIVDGLEINFNMVYLITQMPYNCIFSSAWYSENYTTTGFICYNETDYYLSTYYSSCPQQYLSYPCQIPFTLEFTIDDPANILNPVYYYNVNFSAGNLVRTLYLNANFELLIYGQVIQYAEQNNNKNEIAVYYKDGTDLSYILDGFTGNNITYKIHIDNDEIALGDSEFNPLEIQPNLLELTNYTNPSNIRSITAIANTPYVAIYDDNAIITILNSSDYNIATQEMNVLGTISFEIFKENLISPGVQYVSTINDSFLISASCMWTVEFLYYWKNIPNLLVNSSNYLIILTEISLTSFKMIRYETFQIPFQPSQLKAITDDSSKLAILLVDYTIDYANPYYKNNRLYRAEFIWNQNTLEFIGYEIIDMFSLNLNALYIYSVDGYYYDYLHIVLADKWNGILILVITAIQQFW